MTEEKINTAELEQFCGSQVVYARDWSVRDRETGQLIKYLSLDRMSEEERERIMLERVKVTNERAQKNPEWELLIEVWDRLPTGIANYPMAHCSCRTSNCCRCGGGVAAAAQGAIEILELRYRIGVLIGKEPDQLRAETDALVEKARLYEGGKY